MKKYVSIILTIIMLFSVVNVSVFATGIATPKTASANAVGGIQVDWNEISGAVKYNVYRRGAGEKNYTYLDTTTGNTYLDKTVKNGQYYCYTVRSFNADGDYSAYVYANTSTRKYVATPKLTKLINSTEGLTLSWDSVLSGASYRVYRRGAGQTTWTYLGTTTATTYTDSKATSGNYWRYTVRAVSSGYYSGFDTNGLYTMRLANPYSIKASQVQNGVNVTWAKINGATGYRVYRRGAGQTSWTYLGAITGTSFKDTKVSYGQYYRYTVRATRGNVFSGFYAEGAVIKVNVTKAAIYDCYKSVLNSYPEEASLGKYMYDTEYTLYDIDKNGIPELIVNETIYNYYVYTCINGKAKFCGEFSSNYGNSLYGTKGNGLVVHDGGMGRYHVEYLWLFTLNNGVLSDSKTIITTESNYTYDDLYKELKKYTPIGELKGVRDFSILDSKLK